MRILWLTLSSFGDTGINDSLRIYGTFFSSFSIVIASKTSRAFVDIGVLTNSKLDIVDCPPLGINVSPAL